MKLTDLCDGDLIQFRNGHYATYLRKYLYTLNVPNSVSPYYRIEASIDVDYMFDLSHKRLRSFDIMKIYRPSIHNIELLWAREGKTETTLIEGIEFFELYRVGENKYVLYNRASDEVENTVLFNGNNQVKIKGDIDVWWLEKIIKDRKEMEYKLSIEYSWMKEETK